jgi:hypothetical protein
MREQERHRRAGVAAGSSATCVAASNAGGATWRGEMRPARVARAAGGRAESHVVRKGRRGGSGRLGEAAGG